MIIFAFMLLLLVALPVTASYNLDYKILALHAGKELFNNGTGLQIYTAYAQQSAKVYSSINKSTWKEIGQIKKGDILTLVVPMVEKSSQYCPILWEQGIGYIRVDALQKGGGIEKFEVFELNFSNFVMAKSRLTVYDTPGKNRKTIGTVPPKGVIAVASVPDDELSESYDAILFGGKKGYVKHSCTMEINDKALGKIAARQLDAFIPEVDWDYDGFVPHEVRSSQYIPYSYSGIQVCFLPEEKTSFYSTPPNPNEVRPSVQEDQICELHFPSKNLADKMQDDILDNDKKNHEDSMYRSSKFRIPYLYLPFEGEQNDVPIYVYRNKNVIIAYCGTNNKVKTALDATHGKPFMIYSVTKKAS